VLRKSYLLVPMMPTPNGPLHLGHIAGPYLKLDVLRRYLLGEGHTVAMVSSTDAFDAYVKSTANAEGVTSQAVAARYHREIRTDFERLSIFFDLFVDPASAEEVDGFSTVHRSLVRELQLRGAVIQTDVALADKDGRILEAFEVEGDCGCCGKSIVGYSCEACGFSNGAGDVIRPRQRDGTQAFLVARRGLALKKAEHNKITATIEGYSLPQPFLETAQVIVARSHLLLTAPGAFGVCRYEPYDAPLYNTYFGHAIFAGMIAKRSNNAFEGAFSTLSDIITVTSLGIDNCVDIPASAAMALAVEGRRPFDHCLGNFFLDLNGKKFSTSRNHAIFVAGLSNRVSCDSLRFYLALISPETGVENFDVDDYVRFHNDVFCGELMKSATNLALRAKTVGAADKLKELPTQSYALNCTSLLQPALFSLQGYARLLLKEWRAMADVSHAEAPLYLAGLLSAAEPLIPKLCHRLQRFADGDDEVGVIERINRNDLPLGRR
jgi:methionyl-tRNA synthetase